jgi:hypothetical protein
MTGVGLFLVALGGIYLYGGMTDRSPVKILQALLAGKQLQDVPKNNTTDYGPLVPLGSGAPKKKK